MACPESAPEIFGIGIQIIFDCENNCVLSDELVKLFLQSRQAYDWPRNTGALTSQKMINETNSKCKSIANNLHLTNVGSLLLAVSDWGGNNENARKATMNLSNEQKSYAIQQIQNLRLNLETENSIRKLTDLPGIDLVMATKVYRFCSERGAALDRHSSYFFNSLPVVKAGQITYCTNFKREWKDGRHINSRLASYNASRRAYNLNVYITQYLAILDAIATYLNNNNIKYRCVVDDLYKNWAVADVEMAAYYWWALNGNR